MLLTRTQLAVFALAINPCTIGLAQQNPVVPVAASAVKLTDSFWSPRLETIRTVTIPMLLERLSVEGGPISNFQKAALALKGTPGNYAASNTYQDAYAYQVIELASCSLAIHPDDALSAKLDTLIAQIAAAQEPDGYLYTPRTINSQNPLQAAGTERWQNEKLDSYELFDMGCLIDAAVAHHQATGKMNLLNVAVNVADMLDQTFGPYPNKRKIWPGHPGIEMALIRLSREIHAHYEPLADSMLDNRGPDAGAAAPARGNRGGGGNAAAARGSGSSYAQAQSNFAEMTQTAGYAPGMLELLAAAAALAPEKPAYAAPVNTLYNNLITAKLHITGGIPTDNAGVLPRNFNLSSLNTSSNAAASAAFVGLNEELFLQHPDAQYIDLAERTLYNALLASLSFDGKTFFDQIPLESTGGPPPSAQRAARFQRHDNFTTPYSAIMALSKLEQFPAMLYAQSGDSVYVNFYAQNTAAFKLPNGRNIRIEEQTTCPWDGDIKFTITPDRPTTFAIHMRLPAWSRGKSGTGLYSFSEELNDRLPPTDSARLNGQALAVDASKEYLVINRQWSAGETLELSFPMRPRNLESNPQLTDAKNRVSIQRGPLIYCAEANDNPSQRARNIVLPNGMPLEAALRSDDLLGTVQTLSAKAFTIRVDESDHRVRSDLPISLIPYYAFANRPLPNGAIPEMSVWLAAADSAAVAASTASLTNTARLSASPHPPTAQNPAGPPTTNLDACRDGMEPRSSGDNSPLSHFDWWPATNGTPEWVMAEWDTPQTITSTSVYWWDDTGVGECRPPTSWRALYKDGNDWKPVPTNDAYGLDKDKYNRINFSTPIKTTALKLELIMPQSGQGQRLSSGIQEWKIR